MKREGMGRHYQRLVRSLHVTEVNATVVCKTQTKETLSVEVIRQFDLMLSLIQVLVVRDILERSLVPQSCLVAQEVDRNECGDSYQCSHNAIPPS